MRDLGEANKNKQIAELETYIHIDFRLLDVSLEISALEEHLELIEKQIDSLEKSEKIARDAFIKDRHLSLDDPEWDEVYHEYYHKVESLLPRLFRGPFLISLYAVYESAITEIANLIQKTQQQHLRLDDIRGEDFLDRAKKYYKHVLGFELCKDNTAWQHITMLSDLRNAIAHANGRLEMLRSTTKGRIRKWEKEPIGLKIIHGYIIVDSAFLKKVFSLVRGTLNDLVERYKRWDDIKNPPQKGSMQSVPQ